MRGSGAMSHSMLRAQGGAAHLRKAQQVVDQLARQARRLLDIGEEALAQGSVFAAGRLEQQVGEADDVAQRRAQVVRDRIRKGFEFLVGAAEFLGQFRHLLRALERDAEQGAAEFARQLDLGRVPGQADAVDHLAPGGKAGARGELPRRALGCRHFLYLRFAGPFDGMHHFGAEPQQVMLVHARDRHRQQAAGVAADRRRVRIHGRQLVGVVDLVAMALQFQPADQGFDVGHLRRVAIGQHALVGDDRDPAGAREAQQLGGDGTHVLDDVGALGQVAQHGDHHAPHLEAELQFAGILARLDAQC
jgi:hypothetical protein